MIVSDAPNCGVTYDCHYDDCNSFIIQATAVQTIRRRRYKTLIFQYDAISNLNCESWTMLVRLVTPVANVIKLSYDFS